MRARRRFLSLFFHFFVSILDTSISVLLLDGLLATFMVYCLLGQIQIWVGFVASALRSDHSVLYVVVLWWCISVLGDLYLTSFEDLGGIRATIAVINRAHGSMKFSNSDLHCCILQVTSGIYGMELPSIPLFSFLRLASSSTSLYRNIYRGINHKPPIYSILDTVPTGTKLPNSGNPNMAESPH